MLRRLQDVELSNAIEVPDFAARRAGPPTWHLLATGAMIVVLLLASTMALFTGMNSVLYFMVLLTLGGIGWFVVHLLRTTQDMIVAAEFQNAMFAAAVSLEQRFCLIVDKTGTIVYHDRAFLKMFDVARSQGTMAFDMVLRSAGVSVEDQNEIINAIRSGGKARVIFSLPVGEDTDKLILTIDPLPRPHGFNVLRARPYVEYRSERDGQVDIQAVRAAAEMLDHVRDGVYATSIDGTFTYINAAFAEALGYDVSTPVQSHMSLNDLLFLTSGNASRGVVVDDFNGEVTFRTRDSRPITGHVSQHALRAPSGELIGARATVTFDHTAKPAAQPAAMPVPVQHAETLPSWREFLESSPIAIAVLDADGKIKECNPAFGRMSSIDCQRSSGISFSSLMKDGDSATVAEAVRQARNAAPASRPAPIEVHFTHQDTSASLYVTPSPAAQETGGEVIAYLIDTTEQKNLEMRFVHSQKMQAVGQLAGGIAHDFNNLLTAMIGFCDLLLMRHPAGDPSFADVMQVKQNANRAANLVRQLLAFSRRQTLQPKTTDITEVLSELSNLVRRLIGENIELKITHERGLGLVKVDQGQLEQVLINLAVNARDAMNGGGSLTIKTSNVTIRPGQTLPPEYIPPAEDDIIPAGEYVRISVADTGTGIPRDIITKIFEPFFSTKEVGSGTGLGLSTVYGIVKQTGGYIYVASVPGTGTTFDIYLKRHTGEDTVASAEADVSERSGGGDLTGKGTLLLVEDEAPVRIFAARALRNKGYTVLEADCAETALDVVDEHGKDIEVIVTDVIMPGMNGPAMIEEIHKQHAGIKVIFISGYAEDAFVNTYGADRSFNFLPKPFTLKQLASKVKEVMSGS